MSVFLSFVLLISQFTEVELFSVQKNKRETHDLCSHTQQTKDQIRAPDSTSEVGEEPQPGAMLELHGGAFDASL